MEKKRDENLYMKQSLSAKRGNQIDRYPVDMNWNSLTHANKTTAQSVNIVNSIHTTDLR